MVPIYGLVYNQGRQSFAPDICIMIPAIKSDWAGQPGVELRGDGLYGAYVSECMCASPLRHMDHVYCFDLWWNFFCPPVLC